VLSVILLGLIAAAAAGMIALVDEPRTDDMRKLAVIAALAGLVGGATRSLLEIAGAVGHGFELSDGTPILRGRAAAWHTREVRDWEQRRARHDAHAHAPGAAAELDEPRPEPSSFGTLSISDIPEMIVSPLVGAVLGVVVFAGVVGGFLVASADTGTYSPAALIFIAFLGGVFSAKFLERLSAASDALFGTQSQIGKQDAAAGQRRSEGRSANR
jgi:hypothetical protein